MKTVINAEAVISKFFGDGIIEAVMKPVGFIDRSRCVRMLRDSKEASVTNVETRIAFISIYQYADGDVEEGLLCQCMGISQRTLYRWKKDHSAYLAGELKLRTVVIREGK